MYDAGKIIPGLVIFGALLTLPLWYDAVSGRIDYVPEPEISTNATQCIESKQYMRDNHMQLLNEWRQLAVRDGVRTYVASDGKQYEISLVGTCLGCHSNKQEFCDKCHDYVGVSPDCWNCHVAPEEGTGNGTK